MIVLIWIVSFFFCFKTVATDADACDTNIHVVQPSVLGRNVTLWFQHTGTSADDTVNWRKKSTFSWQKIQIDSKFSLYRKDDMFYMTLIESNMEDNNTRYYAVVAGKCATGIVDLELKPMTNCGYIYVKSPKIRDGENVEIGYFPQIPILNPIKERIYWTRFSNNCLPPDGCLITPEEGLYEEREDTNNNEFILTLFNVNERMNGNYSVRCPHDTDKTDFTNTVSIRIPKKPSVPVLTPVTDIDQCPQCITGLEGSTLDIYCNTTGGTAPLSVTISVNKKVYAYRRLFEGFYRIKIPMATELHGKSVTCSVLNEALDNPLTVSRVLYVTKTPSRPALRFGELIEGQAINISCEVTGGRPSPNIGFEIDLVVIHEETSKMTEYILDENTYTSTATLSTMARQWNGKSIKCCFDSKWFNRTCSSYRTIDYKFPPERLEITLTVPPYTDSDTVTITAVCTSYNANPECKPEIHTPKGVMRHESQPNRVSTREKGFTSKLQMVLEVPKSLYGQLIWCNASCTDFDWISSNSTKIVFPVAPNITFNMETDVINVTVGSNTRVKCRVESFPMSHVYWSRDNEEVKDCGKVTECRIKIRSDELRDPNVYTCHAVHDIGNVSKTITVFTLQQRENEISVTSSQAPTKNELDGSGDKFPVTWVVIGAVICFLIVIVVTLLLIRQRRKQKPSTVERQAQPNDTGQPLMELDVTYAQIDKSSRATTHDRPSEHAQIDTSSIPTTSDMSPDYAEINKSSRATTHDRPSEHAQIDTSCIPTTSDMSPDYAEIDKSSRAKTHDRPPKQKPEELVYAELDLEPTPKPSTGDKVINRRDSPTEYVGIDFAREMPTADSGVDIEDDKAAVYANQ